jgi:predicted kinase
MAQVVEITAMWNLTGDDIKKAKDELETRRATLKSEYEAEIKRIDAELADIDAVERVAVNFVSSRKGDDAPLTIVAETEKAGEKEASSTDGTAKTNSSESSTGKEDKPVVETAPMEQKGSRWRMRLGTLSETEAAD